jgi:hypothetical protein
MTGVGSGIADDAATHPVIRRHPATAVGTDLLRTRSQSHWHFKSWGLERKKSRISGHIIAEADWLAIEAAYRENKPDLTRAAVMVDRAIARAASVAANVQRLRACLALR